MRIALAVPESRLHAALRDLLAAAGHEVVPAEAADGADLLVRRSPDGPRPTARAVLSLRPRPGGRGEPTSSLVRALREGGEAVWAAPLDAGALVSILGAAPGAGAAPARADRASVPPPPTPANEPPRPSNDDLAAMRGLAELGRVTSTFAHEIRNPLASLASAVELLAKDLVPAERDDVVRMARARLAQMKLLLDDTLRLARPFRGPPAVVDPVPALASAVEIARSDPRFAGVDVRLEVTGSPPDVRTYEEPLRQAALNLLVNAIESQGPRGAIRVLVVEEADGLAIRVRDEGPGIPAAVRAKVFDAFWTTKAAGTGLGLAFVRRLAEGSGGSVVVEDVPPPGACVRILLPRA